MDQQQSQTLEMPRSRPEARSIPSAEGEVVETDKLSHFQTQGRRDGAGVRVERGRSYH